MKIQYNMRCNLAQTLNIIGDKWSLLILHQLFTGNETYKDLQDGLEGIPTNLLSERLKSLESDELVLRELYQSHPPRYKYTLTEKGFDLVDVFTSLMMWGEKHLNKCYKQVVHKNCGGQVQHRYYCPDCGSFVTAQELELINPNNEKGVEQ